jgi:hypothetical protein
MDRAHSAFSIQPFPCIIRAHVPAPTVGVFVHDRRGLHLGSDVSASRLRIAVRDPATGAVGSVAISADVIRSVRGK